ncbi:hypothetical protein ACFX2I_006741 [Malus domestica]
MPKTTPLAVETDSLAEKEETARMGSCEKSTKPVSGKAAEICELLKQDLLEDMNACAKLVDGVKWAVCLSSFAKHTTEYKMTAPLAMMQKLAILAAESMLIDQENTKVAKGVGNTMAAGAYSLV